MKKGQGLHVEVFVIARIGGDGFRVPARVIEVYDDGRSWWRKVLVELKFPNAPRRVVAIGDLSYPYGSPEDEDEQRPTLAAIRNALKKRTKTR